MPQGSCTSPRCCSEVARARLQVACVGLLCSRSGSPDMQCCNAGQFVPQKSCDGAAAPVQVRVGLETAEAGAYQRQVGYMRLLGELYAYRIVDSRCKSDQHARRNEGVWCPLKKFLPSIILPLFRRLPH